MYLEEEDRRVFFKLFFDLLYCVNEKRKIVHGFGSGRYPKSVDMEKACQIRNELFENPAWIEEYVQEHRAELCDDEQEILTSWRRHFMKDTFIVMRNLKKYSVFMRTVDEDARLYGVIGLNHPFADFFDDSELPALVNALLLPFRDKIIYDGLFSAYNIRIGPGLRRNYADFYRTAKAKFGIIESLPFDDSTPKPIRIAPTKSAVTANASQDARERYDEIAPLITAFCEETLGTEFIAPCLFALEKLRRKRPSPLRKGKPNTWACGIVYAIASNNFVFDRSQPYYMTAQDIADGFGLSKSTAQNKSAEINKLLKITYFSPEYLIDDLREKNTDLLQMLQRGLL